ncbi:MAG: GAF domain-containing protein [Anaerolineae bacterium]|nr:GAF domain-containing protein [Anaerolineae bacterium]
MVPATSGDNLKSELERLSRLIQDMTDLLRAQRDVLRQRGISLPPGSVSGLKSVSAELDDMAKGVVASEGELAQLRAVAETTALVNNPALSLDEILNTVMDTVIQLTGAERGYIMLRDAETGKMTSRVARGLDQQTLDSSEFIVSKTIVQRVAETGEPVVTTNAQEDVRFSAQESIVGFSLRSILCVPLNVRGKIIGVAYADNRIRAGLFGPKELDLLVAFANQAAAAIQNARLFESVRRATAEASELQELLNDVFASIVSGVITTDVDDIIITFNRAAQAILGVAVDVQAHDIPLRQVLPMDGEFTELLHTVRAEGRSEVLEVEPHIPSRGPVNLNLRLSPLRDGNNVTQGVAIVMDDLTELRRQEAQLAAVKRYLPPQLVDDIDNVEALALGGLRREMTALFVNVVPFDVLLSGDNTAKFMILLNRYLTVATDAIHEQDGIIDKYMGTEVLSLFNTQLNPAPNHAWRAVQAALNITRGLRQLQEELSEELGEAHDRLYCRIGIHTGVATVGNVGSLSRREFTAIGSNINLAKRLEENTELGQILLSKETCLCCKPELDAHAGTVEVIDRNQITVKGFKRPIPVYEVRYR